MKKALLIGVNKLKNYPENNLNGCVNDVILVRELLIFKGYESKNIRIVTDERATAKNIKERLSWLYRGNKNTDEIFCWKSCHGGQVADRNNNEIDGLQEFLVPYDFDWDNDETWVEDEYEIALINKQPEGVRIISGDDNCHSGGMGDRKFSLFKKTYKKRTLPLLVDFQHRNFVFKQVFGNKKSARNNLSHPNAIRLAACQEDQAAADAFFKKPYKCYNGAFTNYLYRNLIDKNNLSVSELINDINRDMKSDGFSQRSLVITNEKNLFSPIFGQTLV